MISSRCVEIVTSELAEMGIQHPEVELGLVTLDSEMTLADRELFRNKLLTHGLEIIEDKRIILVEKIKIAISGMIHDHEERPKENYSEYLSRLLDYDYTYLSNTFAEVKGITIQQYIILHKIELIKELIMYDELNFTQISDKLHYSSVGHLSSQFKKITGFAPSLYKKMNTMKRQNIERI